MILRRVVAALRLAIGRLRARPSGVVALVFTMAVVASVWVAIPLYAESASSRLLSERIDESGDDGVPFGYLVSYNRLSGGNRAWSDLTALSEYLGSGTEAGATERFGAEVSSTQRLVETVPFDVYTETSERVAEAASDPLTRRSFVSLSDLDRLDVTSGRLPNVSGSGGIEALLHRDVAADFGIVAGQQLTIVNQRLDFEDPAWAVPLTVTGLWSSNPPGDGAPADRFAISADARAALVVPEETMASSVDAFAPRSVANAQWLVLLDSRRVRTGDVDALLARTDGIGRAVDERLRGARVLVDPERSLVGFQREVERLERGLRNFALPTLALLLVTLAAVVGLVWSQRERELVMLRRRGAPLGPIITSAVVEAAGLATLAAALAIAGSRVVAGLIARTETFLKFGDGVDLALGIDGRAVRALVAAIVVLVVLQLLPLVRLLRWDRTTRVRSSETRHDVPWWQRRFVDLAVVGSIAVYAVTVLAAPIEATGLLSNPVVILLPALIAVACGLVVVRFFPAVMSVIAQAADRTDAVATLMAARRAARVRSARFGPLVLLVVTGALSIFTASLARTLDLQLVDRVHHEVGAAAGVVADAPTSPTRATFDRIGLDWGPPVDPTGFERIWGVDDAARIAELLGRVERAGGEQIGVNVVGVDPDAFARAAFWRVDYAQASLPQLMASLASNRDAVLVPSSLAAAEDLRIGDVVGVVTGNGRTSVTVDMVIAGTFEQFPTWVPQSDTAPPVVVDLADLEQRFGAPITQRVLFGSDAFASEAGSDVGQTRADLHRLGVSSERIDVAGDRLERALADPARQGVFGLLTIGFLVSTVLTLASFVLYAVFDHRRQRTELGVLRALGLRQRDLFAVVGLDLVFMAGAGLVTALGVGAALSTWVLPHLVDGAVGRAPALLIAIDWTAAAWIIGGLSVVVLAALCGALAGLRRTQLFDAIKLGATDE